MNIVCALQRERLSPSLSLTFFFVYCVSDVNTSLSSAVTLISSLLSSLLPFLIPLSFSLCVCLHISLRSFIPNTLVTLFHIYSSFLLLCLEWNRILLYKMYCTPTFLYCSNVYVCSFNKKVLFSVTKICFILHIHYRTKVWVWYDIFFFF